MPEERRSPTAVDLPAAELAELASRLPTRIDVDPETVQQDLAKLVLTVVELLRRVVEHQAVRRMEDGDLSDEQVERMGTALLLLEEKMEEIRGVFGLAGEDLNVDLGPLGKLL
ncbi:MAG TPA: gas vesicle protein K [Longimicrobiaceae bacterium]